MKRNKNKTNRFVLGLVLGLLFIGSAVGFARNSSAFTPNSRPQISIVLAGVVERDKEMLNLEKADSVKPGEILHWTITSENKGDAIANEYKAVGKIPAGTVFVADSAKADSNPTVKYSIDGKNFSVQPMIEEKQADGTVKMIPAPVAMYSQVRFEWNASLNKGEKLTANYDVRVK
jgi:uncharacterized repeat protein (TIGR01451 family)